MLQAMQQGLFILEAQYVFDNFVIFNQYPINICMYGGSGIVNIGSKLNVPLELSGLHAIEEEYDIRIVYLDIYLW